MDDRPGVRTSLPFDLPFCPIERTLEVLDSKWTALLLRDLLPGTRRFGELRRSLAGISPKTLADRLRALEDQGIVQRTIYPEVSPRVEYALTDYGQTLRPVLEAMAVWGLTHARRESQLPVHQPADFGLPED